jgi:lipoteichoic acid synthase
MRGSSEATPTTPERHAAGQRFGRHAWLAWAGLVGGPSLLLVGQKALRIGTLTPAVGVLGGLHLLLPDALFAAGLAVLAWAWLAWVLGPAKERGLRAGLLGWQLVLGLLLFVGTASHRYFLTTGTPLDYPMFRLGLVEISERARVASSEIPWGTWLLNALALLTTLVFPGWALRLRSHRGAGSGRWRPLFVAVVGALALVSSAWVPAPAGVGADFMRPCAVNLAMTAAPDDPVSAALLSEARAAPRGASSLLRQGDGPARNVVFLLLESTGARATTPYNLAMRTTPALARWASEGTLVESAHAVVPHTSKALVAILCGFPPRIGVRITEALPGGLPGRCLPDLLREQGYSTVFMQSARGSFEHRADLVAALGFERFEHSGTLPTEGFQQANYFAHEDDVMRAPARAFVEQSLASGRPFVLTLLTGATHHDYREVRRYGTQTHDAQDATRNRWLNAVRRQDHFMDDVLSDLRELGALEGTLVVIVGDHGEAFGEHGLRTHDEVPYEEVLHVPMLLLDGRPAGRVRGPVTQLDIVPTVLDHLGFAPQGGRYVGLPLVAEMPMDRRLHAACYHELRCAVELEGTRKRIHRYGVHPDQVFDLETDPEERIDLVVAWQREAEEARARSRRWVQVTNLMSQTTEGIERLVAEARVTDLPAHARPVTGRFGDAIRVLGVAYPSAPARLGGFVEFTVYYQVLTPLPPNFRLEQAGRGSGARVVNYTHTPVGGLYPASLWRPGEIIADTFSLRVVGNHEGDFLDVSVAFRSDDGSDHLPVVEGESRHPGELFLARVPIQR